MIRRHPNPWWAVGLSLLAPFLTATLDHGLGHPLVVLFIPAAMVVAPLALLLLWAARGARLAALGRAFLLTQVGMLTAAILLLLLTGQFPRDRTPSETVSYFLVVGLVLCAPAAIVGGLTSAALLPFAWYKSRRSTSRWPEASDGPQSSAR